MVPVAGPASRWKAKSTRATRRRATASVARRGTSGSTRRVEGRCMSSRCPEGRELGGGMGSGTVAREPRVSAAERTRGRRFRSPVLSRAGEVAVLAIPALALVVFMGVQHRAAIVALAAPVSSAEAAVRAPTPHSPAPLPALRVCSDPNNLPFSNAKGEGFENRIAELLAREMGRSVKYTWWAQRRGFVRNTLNAG